MENQKERKLKFLVAFLIIVLFGSVAWNYILFSSNDRSTTPENVAMTEEETTTPLTSVIQLTPYVISTSDYVMRGDKYSAQVVLAVDDTTYHPEFYIDGAKLNGRGVYEVLASSVGMKKYTGWVSYIDPVSGDSIRKSFNGKYTVNEPAVVISNTDLNLMYSNYENKFSISVPGVPNDKITVSATGATVKQNNGLWGIIPEESSRAVKISVSAEIDGKIRLMGTKDYRVKQLPSPQVYLSVKDREYGSGSSVALNLLANKDATLVASYGPDGLLMVPFKITSFAVTLNGIILKAEGNHFSEAQLGRIHKAMKGSVLVIQDICAQTPNGKNLRLDPIVLTVK